MLLKKIFSAW